MELEILRSCITKNMAPRNKENTGGGSKKGGKGSKQIAFEDPESSEEDYRQKRDKNNQVSYVLLY